MQVWVESGKKQDGVDHVLGEDLEIGEDGTLRLAGRVVGCAVDVSTAEGQSKARSLAGCVEWILLEFGEWTMIPVENIVAACSGGPTRVAARLRSARAGRWSSVCTASRRRCLACATRGRRDGTNS